MPALGCMLAFLIAYSAELLREVAHARDEGPQPGATSPSVNDPHDFESSIEKCVPTSWVTEIQDLHILSPRTSRYSLMVCSAI